MQTAEGAACVVRHLEFARPFFALFADVLCELCGQSVCFVFA
jgi:hypothetical protein